MDKRRLLVSVLAAALIAGATATGLSATMPDQPMVAKKPARERVNPAVTRRFRNAARRWEALVGLRHGHPRTPLDTRPALRFWRRRESWARTLALHPPHRHGWLCIHRFEGSWGDSGDPYWGGLQMDRGFMSRYAPRLLLHRGWADRWSAVEQMWVAERAFRSGRGYTPWPSTARLCGLL